MLAMSSPCTGAAQRDVGDDHLLPLLAAPDVVHADGVDDAGADRVDADAVRRRARPPSTQVSAWTPALEAA